ncbi:hypothetical protein [Methylobacterium nigriterrae]|uniref:hypothetical protein n=1 Tax=Methylobacterium nigriterrae TaxID=3127512 RepID=UPI0030140295
MKTTALPCPGLTGSKWAVLHEAALDALDRFGAELSEHERTAPELFGVHPNVGIIRSDYCGALMLSGEKATAISADRIRFKLTAYYRHVPGCGVGVPIWAFKG